MTSSLQLPELIAAPALLIQQHPAHPRNYGGSRKFKQIKWIVLHCTDGCEGTTKDTDTARDFARDDLHPRRSCHYVCDADSITQCVRDMGKAWHCGGVGNEYGLGLEICGRARQTRAEWLDKLSLPTLAIAAKWVADKCLEYSIPCTFITAPGLRAGRSGITTHAEVGIAWRETTHTDPGPHFPMDLFLQAARAAMTSQK